MGHLSGNEINGKENHGEYIQNLLEFRIINRQFTGRNSWEAKLWESLHPLKLFPELIIDYGL